MTYASELMSCICQNCRGTFKLWNIHFTASGIEATAVHNFDQQLYRITIVPMYQCACDTVKIIEENDIPEKLAEAVDI